MAPTLMVNHSAFREYLRLKYVKKLPKVMHIKIVVPMLTALLSGMMVIACSGLKRKVGAPSNPQRYQAAIR
jgi:hypothetical protein